MPYAAIMVHVELEHPDDGRIQVAADLAQQFGARLIGIAAAEVAHGPYFEIGAEAQSVLDREQAELRDRLHAAERRFRQKLHNRVKHLEWRSAIALPTACVARQSRGADLIVAGTERGIRLDPVRQLDPAALVLQAGRPVLIVPENGKAPSLKNVLVAWKDTRECRRAVWDALPLLIRADKVTVIEVCEPHEMLPDAEANVKDVVAWLAQHRVTAAGMGWPALHDVSAQIDAVAQDVGADLIVAGAYGHSRLGEWIFGGVTRTLLRQPKRCALLAH
jgi:nucleotide-binding universal stress UspA family protein